MGIWLYLAKEVAIKSKSACLGTKAMQLLLHFLFNYNVMILPNTIVFWL